jgi:DNA-binding transcriptional ArsR family regulator
MPEGPDISIVAALIGNPASANMLMALMAGPALTVTELAAEAGLRLSTVSGHLARLEQAGLVAIARQGRHRYFGLADPDVAIALEALMPVAARAGHLRVRVGPRDPELRRAPCRGCLDWSERRYHLGGALGAAIFEKILAQDWAVRQARTRVVRFSAAGERKLTGWFSP